MSGVVNVLLSGWIFLFRKAVCVGIKILEAPGDFFCCGKGFCRAEIFSFERRWLVW